MPAIKIPSPHSAIVRTTEAEITAMCAHDSRWSNFLRGYLRHALTRAAWNCHLVGAHLGPSTTWLDIGSFGIEPLWHLRRRPDLDVHAVSYEGMRLALTDRGITMVEADTDNAPQLTIDKADVEQDPLPMPDASCDLVTCFECIEHLRSTPRALLDEIRRVLKPDGRLLLTTPNLVGSRAMIRLLAGKNPQENPRYHRDENYGIVHPKEYTMRELISVLDSRGLATAHSESLYFRRVSLIDRLTAAIAIITRPLGGRLLGIGPQPVLLGDNLFVEARPHNRPRTDWCPLVFEPDPFADKSFDRLPE